MDIAAELTLQIARLVHERPDPPRSPSYWSFWPHGHRASWSEAREILASVPKPLFVAPLIEPGVLGLWRLDSFDEAKRVEFEHHFANQIHYYTEKLARFGLAAGGRLRFEPATPDCTLAVGDFLRWAREYAIGVGISIAQSPDPGIARITVRPPGGGGPPLGMQASPYAPAS